MLRLSSFFRAGLLTGLCAVAFGQTTTPANFAFRVQAGLEIQSLSDNGTINIPAAGIGTAAGATLSVTYRGTGTATIAGYEISGGSEFSLQGFPVPPPNIASGQTLTFTIRYLPSSGVRAVGRINFSFQEGTRIGTFGFSLTGVAPDLVYNYVAQPAGNSTVVSGGETIAFGPTLLNEIGTVNMVITNRGSGSGLVSGVSLTGPSTLALAGVPFLPATVEAGGDIRFSIRFSPTQLETAAGQLRLEAAGRVAVFNVQAPASGPLYSYETIRDGSSTIVQPGQAMLFPDVNLNDKASIVVRVRNNGNADGSIAAISVLGTGFQLTDQPFVPLTVTPGSSFNLTLTFSPTTGGRTAGRLRIGDHSFELSANAGPNLAFSYVSSGVSFIVNNNGNVVLPAATVGTTTTARFTITNSGTAATAINTIGTSAADSGFSVSNAALPATLEPGASYSFDLSFKPTALGNTTGTLRIDSVTFNLLGAGSQPPPLPEFSYQGATGVQEPQTQPAVGLTLAAPYPIPVAGAFTLAFNSEVFANDPAVQFSTGGRTVTFTIPANSTEAVFPNNTNRIRMQTGTVAGTITLTPSFSTESGINLTPNAPPSLSLTVTQSAPRVLGVQLGGRTASGFTLLITGFSTSRSVTQMDFQFTPVAGETLEAATVTLNTEASFSAWFQSAPAQQFGGQFTATIPFTLQGDVRNVGNAAEAVQSVSVTITNRQGVSTARSLELK
ncbi:MAG: choice-of-anchor D domain-containing protein [Bryobacteraceae bacterium]